MLVLAFCQRIVPNTRNHSATYSYSMVIITQILWGSGGAGGGGDGGLDVGSASGRQHSQVQVIGFIKRMLMSGRFQWNERGSRRFSPL